MNKRILEIVDQLEMLAANLVIHNNNKAADDVQEASKILMFVYKDLIRYE